MSKLIGLNSMEWCWNGDLPTETEAANDCRLFPYGDDGDPRDFHFNSNTVCGVAYAKLTKQGKAVRFLSECLKMIVREHVDPKAVVRMVCQVRELSGLIPDDARIAAGLPPMTKDEEEAWEESYFSMR